MTTEAIRAEDLRIRGEFPLLKQHPALAYLDNAATAQRPKAVLERMRVFYEEENANPLRGLYDLSQRATEAYENARETVRGFLNASSTEEIVFTRNASESLNLVAYSWGGAFLHEGDEILVTIMEHHSNMLRRGGRDHGGGLPHSPDGGDEAGGHDPDLQCPGRTE